MTCGECKHATRDYHRLIPAMVCLKNRREFARPDLPAERCPCFAREEEK